ncbi:hypothetical protein EOD39_11619 [Acipenser ruthenus]|uniref:Uncharacterized protein n=1 Tax=Acipenser ruthenus TaxID=7906 RepID=A0A662YV25_ACIRT|nr:hypothetical protein EOD39_11619 [Acipenser ruthenus]
MCSVFGVVAKVLPLQRGVGTPEVLNQSPAEARLHQIKRSTTHDKQYGEGDCGNYTTVTGIPMVLPFAVSRVGHQGFPHSGSRRPEEDALTHKGKGLAPRGVNDGND